MLLFHLSIEMGIPVRELGQRITLQEFMQYGQYYRQRVEDKDTISLSEVSVDTVEGLFNGN